MTPEPITDRNQETFDLLAEAVHRMSHQIDQMFREWQELRPLVVAYRGGGLLGLRTAMKRRPDGTDL